ncbi:MAG: hypothetical protein V5A62_02995 [Haloarculaceae archaeon]
MATPPTLVLDGDEPELDAAVGPSRRRFDLSDRAETLLSDLGYGNRDLVPWVTARALVLAGGATLPGGNDARDTAWNVGGADGGREPGEPELRAVADYLRSLAVEDRALDTLREHVRKTDLSAHLDPEELQGRAGKVGGLNDIARNLDG